MLIVLPFKTPIVELSAAIMAESAVNAPAPGKPPVLTRPPLVTPDAFQLIPKSKLFESVTSITSAST